MKMDLSDIFYIFGESPPPSIFPLHFRYKNLSIYALLRSKLTYQKKYIISFSMNIYVIILITIYFELYLGYGTFFANWISVLILLIYCYWKTKIISLKYRHKSTIIITYLTIFYCHSGSNSIKNLANAWLFFT